MLKLRGLTKAYGPTTVLSNVDVDIHPGEVHALLGPNGSGKTTLTRCIAGAVTPTAGTMELDGAPLKPSGPAEALADGIVTIHQHLSSVNALSVSDNIFLGSEKTRWGLVNRRHQVRVTRELLRQFGIAVRPNSRLGDLPIGVRQLVEIVKAWHRNNPRVLILDEPTASLSGPETVRLFERIEAMRQRGTCIIYVTHRLDEVFEIADRVTVLRDGRVSLSEKVANIAPDDVVRAIAPDSRADTSAAASSEHLGEIVLDIDELAGKRFGPVSLSVRAGEVVALFGSVGAGRSSFIETLAGVHPATSGIITLDGEKAVPKSPSAARRRGIAFVPSDRTTQSAWGGLTARDNLNIPSMSRTASKGLRGFARESATFGDTADRLGLRPPNPDLEFERYSGGNQQKIVVGRVDLVPGLRLVLLDEPTQGVDVGARQQIYAEIRRLARTTGCAVIAASSEPSEVLAVADRAIVMEDGQVVAEHYIADIDEVALVDASHASTTLRGRS